MKVVTLALALLTLLCVAVTLLYSTGALETVLSAATGGVPGGPAGPSSPWRALLVVPLYTRLRREGLLNHRLREQIFGYVVTHPGACFSQMMKELNLRNGVLAYHLGTLERERLVRSLREGAFRRYYPCSSPTVLAEPERAILQRINSLPGIAIGELTAELELPRRDLDRHLSSLARRGLVRVERRGKRSLLFATRVAA